MENSQHLLKLARQGDAPSIAILLNQALEPKSIRARAVCKQDCLHILLEAAQTPNSQLAALIHEGVIQLQPSSIRSLYVHGREQGQQNPAWSRSWVLQEVPSTPHLPTLPTPPQSPPHPLPASPQSAPSLFPSPSPAIPSIPAASPVSPASAVSPASPRPSTHLPAHPSPSPRRNRFIVPLAFSAGFVLGAGWNQFANSIGGAWSDTGNESPPEKTTPPDQQVGLANAAAPSPSLEVEAFPEPEPVTTANATQPVLTIKAVGDIIPGTNFPDNRLPSQDGQWLFDKVKPFLGDADILFGNFESTMTDFPHSAKDISRGQTFAFRTPPSYASLFQQLGFDVLSVANNHSLDFGDQGFEDTIVHIQNAGMQAVGRKGEIVYREVNGVSTAFIGFSYFPDHNSILDLAGARALVEQAKQQASIVIISVHAGAEGTDAIRTRNETEYFFGENRGNLVEFSRAMVDQGADLILGHGPHVPRAMELYKGRLIAYSLGNFLGYRTLSTEGVLSYSLILQAQLDAEGSFVSGKIIPVRLDAQGVPYVDDYFQSVSLIRNLIETDFPVTPLLINNDGQIVKNEAPLPTGG